MSIEDLRFDSTLLTKPAPTRWSVDTTLHHFAIVTYWVDERALRKHLHPRFEPVCLEGHGDRRALISVVTFLDRDFRFVSFPWFKGTFGQTNYRAYVRDTQTGEHAAWFFGTCLDSISVLVPRYIWQLPWHRARMRFDCARDGSGECYSRYKVTTRSDWSPGRLTLQDTGAPPAELPGFSNLEAGLVLLTHPLRGYFFRRDGALGSYTIWHDRTAPTVARLQEASYPLLARLNLVSEGSLDHIHSVLVQQQIDFTIYLPPRIVVSRQ